MAMDVITFGETMVLFVPNQVGPLQFAHSFEKTIGGAESNVAIGLSRLGHEVGWFGRLGNDGFGRYVRNFIRGEGVDTSRVIFDDEYPTAVFFKERKAFGDPNITYYRKDSAASHLAPSDLDEAYIAKSKYLHITGITPAISASARETLFRAIEIAKHNGVTVTFDPNLRRKLWPEEEARRVLLDIAAHVDMILPGLEEGEFMTGEKEVSCIADKLLSLGPKLVVLKLGKHGAYYRSFTQNAVVDATPVEHIVDPIGAGDAFVAGFLSGMLRGMSTFDAVSFGNKMGAYALTVPGDVEGLPEWNDNKGEQYAR